MNIFIASLPYRLEETEIKEIFEDYGQVNSVKLITDRETGRSKGYGFIDMPNDEEALKAIEILNGTEIYDRNISVSQALDKKGDKKSDFRGERRSGYNSGGGNKNFRTGFSRENGRRNDRSF